MIAFLALMGAAVAYRYDVDVAVGPVSSEAIKAAVLLVGIAATTVAAIWCTLQVLAYHRRSAEAGYG